MRRLLSMSGHQLALTMILGTFAGVAAYVLESWSAAKILLTFSAAVGLLGGTALGWIRGGPAPVAGAGRSVARGIGGAVVGVFVFSNVGLAVGLAVGYFVGGSAMFESVVPTCGTVGALAGVGLGYMLAR